MINAKESGNEEVRRARLVDKVDCVENGLILIKYLIIGAYMFRAK